MIIVRAANLRPALSMPGILPAQGHPPTEYGHRTSYEV
jgi:hypothetical protein